MSYDKLILIFNLFLYFAYFHSRKNPFTLKVALEDSDNHGLGWRASGELFWDDGSSIDTYENGNYYYAKFQSDQVSLYNML